MDTKIGKIIHYYPKISVAVISVLRKFKVGDKIKISGHDKEFEQEVSSMQIDYKGIKEAEKGTEVAIKVDQEVKKNDEVHSV